MPFHSATSAQVATLNGMTTNIFKCTVNRDSDFLMSIFTSHIRPGMEYASCLWNLHYLCDLRLMERLQKRWTKEVNGLANLSYDERLKVLNMYSFQGRLLRYDLIYVWKIFHNQCEVSPRDLFTLDRDSLTRGHVFKIHVPLAKLELRRRFFSVRVISYWNSLAADTVEAVSLSVFKRLLHRDLGWELYRHSC